MAHSVVEELEILNARLVDFGIAHENLLRKVAELEEENRLLKEQIRQREISIKSLNKDIDFLKISYKLADSPDNIVTARHLIARLIHSIDSCIALIKED